MSDSTQTPVIGEVPAASVNLLNELVTQTKRDRERMAAMFKQFKVAFATERSRSETAIAENIRLTAQVEDLTAKVTTLTASEAKLMREVAMLATAISFANNEIASSDSDLLSAVEGVEDEISVSFEELHPEMTDEARELARLEAADRAQAAAEADRAAALEGIPSFEQLEREISESFGADFAASFGKDPATDTETGDGERKAA